MSRWYYPSYRGDFRLLDASESTYRDHVEGAVLEVVSPTEVERSRLDAFLKVAFEKKWTAVRKLGTDERQDILLSVGVDEAGKALLPLLRPADRTITAIRSDSGKLAVHDTAELLAEPVVEGEVVENSSVPGLTKPPKKPKKGSIKLAKDDKAVSVRRPTLSCPQCTPGAVDRASEVLLSFLGPEEHDTWARRRLIIVEGGLTGHRYVLAHRHSEVAQKLGRICFDIDDGCVVHFHDNSVPPEEEVLAAKLVLEHREPWLRNEATMLGMVWSDLHAERFEEGTLRLPDGTETSIPSYINLSQAQMIFKNPFGDFWDGVWDAHVTQGLGTAFRMFGTL